MGNKYLKKYLFPKSTRNFMLKQNVKKKKRIQNGHPIVCYNLWNAGKASSFFLPILIIQKTKYKSRGF